MPKPDFDSSVFKAIDQGLNMLGESPKKVLVFHLEKALGIEWQNILNNLAGFEETLRIFFGPGYNYIDSIFRQNLENSIGQNLEQNKTFTECVKCLREKEQK